MLALNTPQLYTANIYEYIDKNFQGSTMGLLTSSNAWFILPTDPFKQYTLSEDGLILVLSDDYCSSLNRTVKYNLTIMRCRIK